MVLTCYEIVYLLGKWRSAKRTGHLSRDDLLFSPLVVKSAFPLVLFDTAYDSEYCRLFDILSMYHAGQHRHRGIQKVY